MELWARAINRINSLCKKKLLRGYCPLKSAHKGLQQTREEITADLQLVSFCEGSVQARCFTLSFSRCHLMKFYKLSGSRQGQCVNGRGTRRRREWVRWFGRRCSCPRPPCRATLGGAMLRNRVLITSVAADLMALVFGSTQVAAPAARPNY